MEFPSNVKYINGSEGIRVEGDIAYVGTSDYAQQKNKKKLLANPKTEAVTISAHK